VAVQPAVVLAVVVLVAEPRIEAPAPISTDLVKRGTAKALLKTIEMPLLDKNTQVPCAAAESFSRGASSGTCTVAPYLAEPGRRVPSLFEWLRHCGQLG
jgi:hypothetical protein